MSKGRQAQAVPSVGNRKGNRPGNRRPKYNIDRDVREMALEGISPLEFLIGVMRDTKKPLQARIDAARAAAPYVHPTMPRVVELKPAKGSHLIPPLLPGRQIVAEMVDEEGNIVGDVAEVEG